METRQKNLTPDMFRPSERGLKDAEAIGRDPIGFWEDAWKRLLRNRVAIFSLVLLAVIILMAFVGPLLTPYTSYGQNLDRALERPSAEYWFGTDSFGRSMFDRVWEGTRVSLYIALIATAIDIGIGMFYGAISGYYGGRVDNIMQRFTEIVIGIPNLVVIILLLVVLPPGILTIALALSITAWAGTARLIRGQVLSLKNQEFFLASRTLGAGARRLILKHLIPNVLYLVIITLMFTVPTAIFFEAFLSFIGLGIQVPQASLGSLMEDGAKNLQFEPYLVFFPALILASLLLCFNLLGDGLRDALDPRMRR